MVSLREILYQLLPDDGGYIAFDAAIAAASGLIGRQVDENELAQCVFALGAERVVDWLPSERQIKRGVLGQNQLPPSSVQKERDLEPWFERYLWSYARSFYDPSPLSFSAIVELTARVHGGPGRWTRPDLCMACVSKYRYVAAAHFDLFSFELKMPTGCNILAVHEALAHTAAANFAYLAAYIPSDAPEEIQLPAMLEQAQRHGVGFIRISIPSDFSSYRKLLEPRRHDPAPARVDGFIEERFSRANRLALQRWVHS